jgi:Family of unknown function (DUF5985)
MIPHIVYILCVLTCAGCALLLWRAFRRTHSRLLFWSSLFFLILGVANVLLFLDLSVYPEVDLVPWRSVVVLAAVLVLVFGLVFESA